MPIYYMGNKIFLPYNVVSQEFFYNKLTAIEADAWILDYAQGFGNSYSRIDYIPVYGDKIAYEFEPTGGGDNFNFGTRTNTSSNGYTLISNYDMGFVGYGGATTNTPPIKSTLNEIHTVKMSKDGIFLDDVQISYTTGEQDGLYNMVIGALAQGETTIDTRSAIAKHRAFTVHSEDDVLKHRILAVVKDGVCQLYDNVTNAYYPSLADEYGQGDRIGYVKNGVCYDMDNMPMFVDAWILDYIESTGTQYIDTDVYASNDVKTSIDFEFTDTSVTQCLLGVFESECKYFTFNSANVNRWIIGTGSNESNVAQPYVANERATLTYNNSGEILLNNIVLATGDWTTSSIQSMMLFTRRINGNVQSNLIAYAKVYKALFERINDDNVELYPFEKQDGTICMWDKVTNTYKTNQGTGDFLGGERVGYVLNGIAYNMDGTEMFPEEVDGYQLQSIHLSNGAYFDTGYYPIPNATDTHCWMAMSNNTEATRGVFGARGQLAANNQSATVFWNVTSSAWRNKFRLDLLGGASNISEVIELNTMVEFHNYSQAKKVIVDGIERTATTTMSSARLAFPYLIGSFSNTSNTPFATTEMDIGQQWNITEWVDGVEVPQRSYVPWFRTSDNVACLRDTLTGEFLDAVTGTVTAGEPLSSAISTNAQSLSSLGVTPTYDYSTDAEALNDLGVDYA